MTDIRTLSGPDELVRANDVLQQVWGTDVPLAPLELLVAVAHTGGYVAGAFDGDEMVGASVGLLAVHGGRPALHSHVTGLLRIARGTGLGRAVKLHQRTWAINRGLERITWTFDPLVRRNAWFNIAVLGARVEEYLPSFYGSMHDAINAGDESDRLYVSWDLAAELPTSPRDGGKRMVGADLVPTPDDIVELRRSDPDAVVGWRSSTAARPRRGARRRQIGCRIHPRRQLRDRITTMTSSPSSFTIEHVELRRIAMPLVTPFRTSFGSQTERDILLVRAVLADATGGSTDTIEGWGECVALSEPSYSPEYVDGAQHVIVHHLLPRLVAAGPIEAADVAPVLAKLHGHPMAKAALEMAILDAQLRANGQSFAAFLGAERTRIPSGVSVGIHDRTDDLLAAVQGYVDDGYVRIKLKIEPGSDIDQVAAVRELIGPDTPFQVDANTAYRRTDGEHLRRLDEFDLLLIEQPLPEDDIIGHARLAAEVDTPICLDESLVSAAGTADAIELGACEIANIKPGRVGGYLEAVRIHDLCLARGVPVWCGGMLETGIGRAANAALAALPGFTLPGDISASTRFYARDIVTDPITIEDGHVAVPTTPGLGFELDRSFLDQVTTSRLGIDRRGTVTSL